MIAPAVRALFFIAAVSAAPAWAQMPSAVVGGTNLTEASRAPTGTAGSSERRAATRTRSVGEGIGSLSAVSASPGGAALQDAPGAPALDGLAVPAGLVAAPAARPAEPGAPIRIRRPAAERADARRPHVPGEAIHVTAPARPTERSNGPGASIHIVE